MTSGVLVKASNSIYYKRKVELIFETIPQLIFLVLVFGYMDFLIIFKWLKPWGYGNPHAPSIITTMINLPLMVGKTVNYGINHLGQRMLSWWLANVGNSLIYESRSTSKDNIAYCFPLHPVDVISQANLLNKKT